tara:strand:- start:169 stop:1095 length:927 start_codon:yes stop_codon:yes gene_type:complete
MKHNIKVTAILLIMFLITQLIGLAVINAYSSPDTQLPFGMEPPEVKATGGFSSLIFAFIIAIALIFLLMRFNLKIVLRIWFFVVVVIALGISFNSILIKFNLSELFALVIALPFAYYKIFKRNILIHNITELFIYPGIAAVFVFMFLQWGSMGLLLIIILLILISIYDIYAVWHSGIMQKMAKFQMEQVKVFAGFFVPYLNPKQRKKIKLMKQKAKESKSTKKELKEKKIKVNLAILGGGDVVFPLILAGVVLKTLGLFQALSIIIFASLALLFLFIKAEKGKFYPAMPFITAGCLIGLAAGYLVTLI